MHHTRYMTLLLLFIFSLSAMAKPISLFLDIQEQTYEQSTSNVRDILSLKFTHSGYQSVTLGQLDEAVREELLRFLDGDLTVDNITALRQHVDFLITGRAFLQQSKALISAVPPQSAIVDLTIVALSTGQEIYNSRTIATSTFANEKRVGEKAFLIAVNKAYKSLTSALENTQSIKSVYHYKLLLHGVKNVQLLKIVFAQIQRLPQVVRATLKAKRVRRVQVESKLNLENFIAQISAMKSARYHIKIKELRGDVLQLQVIDHHVGVDAPTR